MIETNLLPTIAQLVTALDQDKAVATVQEALDQGYDPVQVLQEGVVAGLKAIGDMFGAGEYFLPELMMGADVSEACMVVITPHLPEREGPRRGVVVLGTVQGDIHDIGKAIVGRQLSLAGYDVYDLGVDVASMRFIDKAREVKADIIGLSAFLDTTRPYYGEVLDYLRDMGLRSNHKVIIGGVAAGPELVNSIGADGWAPDAVEAVKLCDRLMGQSGPHSSQEV